MLVVILILFTLGDACFRIKEPGSVVPLGLRLNVESAPKPGVPSMLTGTFSLPTLLVATVVPSLWIV